MARQVQISTAQKQADRIPRRINSKFYSTQYSFYATIFYRKPENDKPIHCTVN